MKKLFIQEIKLIFNCNLLVLEQSKCLLLNSSSMVRKSTSSVNRIAKSCLKEVSAWNAPYEGSAANKFVEFIIDDPVRNSEKGLRGFLNQIAILQSSGMGKSRLADEVAKKIFTIPICLSKKTESECI